MQDLIRQEVFELEVLDRLNSGRLLPRLVFGGGTMLRLCHGLERYSVDLDFWGKPPLEAGLFTEMSDYLLKFYTMTDAADKFHPWLFELRSPSYPGSLKIEIRKEAASFRTEQAIAFSRHSTVQVLVTVLSLRDMARSKIRAFLERKEIRDVYDLEFLYRKGALPDISLTERRAMLDTINGLSRQDYQVKLGSLLEEPYRTYYRRENFKILRSWLHVGPETDL